MVAFQDGTIHDVANKVGDYNKTGGVPRPQPQVVTEHDAIGWTDVYSKSVKVKVNTHGHFSLVPACLVY